MINKLVASTSILLAVATGGYLVTEKQVTELEKELDQRSYIHAKQVIDQRGNTIDLSKVVGSSTVERVIINGQEWKR